MDAFQSRFLSRRQAREIDRRAVEKCGMSSLVLMENSGRGAADVLERLGIAGPVLICCGKGNNGGDGLVMARHLDLRGRTVRVALWGDDAELSDDCRANLRVLKHCDVPIECFGPEYESARLAQHLGNTEWIVDALFGTGIQGELRPPFAAVLAQLNAHGGRRLAVDLPSGLDADTGAAALHTFRADHTATLVALKRGFQNPQARPYTGQVHVVDIGAPRRLVEAVLERE